MIELPASVRAAARLALTLILTLPNVVGIGAGQKRVAGRATGEPGRGGLRLAKAPAGRIAPHRACATDGRRRRRGSPDRRDRGRRIPIRRRRYRNVSPVRGGCQIFTAGGTGTAGAVMYDRRDQQIVLLTNRHVLTTECQSDVPARRSDGVSAAGRRSGGDEQAHRADCQSIAWRGRLSGHEQAVDAGLLP